MIDKLLIIGSRGFLGSNFTNYFNNKEINVFSCDFLANTNQRNYFKVDPFNSDYIEIFEKQQFDLVINCVGSANVGASIENPFFDFDLNVTVVSKILGAIYKTNPQTKFINISSAAVYGNPKVLPIRPEFAENTRSISPYGVHKRLSEILLKNYYDSFEIPTCSLRIFSAYGNGQKKLLMWDLLEKFLHNKSKTVELFGTGNETRDFIHIDDIIQQLELIIESAPFKGEAINVANGVEVKIGEVANLFKITLNSDKSIVFNNLTRKGDPLNWCADITQLNNWGYLQSVTLQDGIQRFIEWNCEKN